MGEELSIKVKAPYGITGLGAVVVRTLFLRTRIWDRNNYPLMGFVPEYYKLKKGKIKAFTL